MRSLILIILSLSLVLSFRSNKNLQTEELPSTEEELPSTEEEITCINYNCICISTTEIFGFQTCASEEEKLCYDKAECKVQEDGLCGFTQTPELMQCLPPKQEEELDMEFNN